jgi:hypothetical protein
VALVGLDDRNEGDQPGECDPHQWDLHGLVLAGDGAYVEQTCTGCGTTQVITPGELTGRAG